MNIWDLILGRVRMRVTYRDKGEQMETVVSIDKMYVRCNATTNWGWTTLSDQIKLVMFRKQNISLEVKVIEVEML